MATSERPVSLVKYGGDHYSVHNECGCKVSLVLILESGEVVDKFSDVMRIIQMGEVAPYWRSAFRCSVTGDLFYAFKNAHLDHVR